MGLSVRKSVWSVKKRLGCCGSSRAMTSIWEAGKSLLCVAFYSSPWSCSNFCSCFVI
jgi:hypothetical protein